MIYIVSLDQEEDITGLIFSGDKEVVINFLIVNFLIESDIKRKTIENLIRDNLSIYGIFFFKQVYCIVDMDFSGFKSDLFSKNYNNLIAFIRDEKLKKLGV